MSAVLQSWWRKNTDYTSAVVIFSTTEIFFNMDGLDNLIYFNFN